MNEELIQSSSRRSNVAIVVGTRPEAIKMAPVIFALKAKSNLNTQIISTGQHRELLGQALDAFGLKADVDLKVMKPGASLVDLTCTVLERCQRQFLESRPDLVLVHGDTASAFSSALACFYMGIPVAHVEAGLRTYHLDSPFPEEFQRQNLSRLANYHFAPDQTARQNLLSEGIPENRIQITGNPIFDTIRSISDSMEPVQKCSKVLVTLHRRENGPFFKKILNNLKQSAKDHDQTSFIYPVHPNPASKSEVFSLLSDIPNVTLKEPMGYPDFIQQMLESQVIITDSGGIQEEAAVLGKRVLLVRSQTERDIGLKDGSVTLVGNGADKLRQQLNEALLAPTPRALPALPTGASLRIADCVQSILCA